MTVCAKDEFRQSSVWLENRYSTVLRCKKDCSVTRRVNGAKNSRVKKIFDKTKTESFVKCDLLKSL